MKWKEQLNGDCPRCDSRLHDRCDLVCPDLPKVLQWSAGCQAMPTRMVDGSATAKVVKAVEDGWPELAHKL
jgi:hypothetical protein